MSEDCEPLRCLSSKGYLKISKNGFIDETNQIIDLENDISETAFVYVHGFRSTPSKSPVSKKITNFLISKNCDLYAPLLKFHGMKNLMFFRYNPYIVFEKFKKDLEFILNLNYKKICFVGFSHGGLQVTRASLEGLLDDRCSIVLLCPQLMFNRQKSPIKSGIIMGLNVFAQKFFKFEQETFKMMISSGIQNRFSYILGEKDVYVSPQIHSFLSVQPKLFRGFLLKEYGHFPFSDKKFYDFFDECLEVKNEKEQFSEIFETNKSTREQVFQTV